MFRHPYCPDNLLGEIMQTMFRISLDKDRNRRTRRRISEGRKQLSHWLDQHLRFSQLRFDIHWLLEFNSDGDALRIGQEAENKCCRRFYHSQNYRNGDQLLDFAFQLQFWLTFE